MHPRHVSQQMDALRARMAQVADLQRERRQLIDAADRRRPVDWALRLAQIDAALRLARNTLVSGLRELPEPQRTQFIRAHGPAATNPGLVQDCTKTGT